MLAKALAKESNACFINVRAATLQSKWRASQPGRQHTEPPSFLTHPSRPPGPTNQPPPCPRRFGDAQKLVTAVFTLAWKIQPCIIFIDEIDSFLGTRKSSDHEAVNSMKTEFMSLWDGFLTDNDARVMVLAATNRPWCGKGREGARAERGGAGRLGRLGGQECLGARGSFSAMCDHRPPRAERGAGRLTRRSCGACLGRLR